MVNNIASILPHNHITFESESMIRNMIAPLKKIADIHYFCFGVNYADRTCYSLLTHTDFYTSWFKHKGTLRGYYLKNGWHFYDPLLPSELFKQANSNDIGKFITYIDHQKDKTIIFEFGTRPDNPDWKEKYKNNIGILKRFGHYFSNEIAKTIVDEAARQRIVPNYWMTQQIQHDSNQYEFFNHDATFSSYALTEREKQYLKYLFYGYLNEEIANDVNLSPKTISKCLYKIMKKLYCESKTELFFKAIECGVIHYNFNSLMTHDKSGPDVYEDAIHDYLHELYHPISTLSPQELKCYFALLQGCTIAEIGQRVCISTSTAADYISRLKVKLKCKTKNELFYHAIQNGFMDVDTQF